MAAAGKKAVHIPFVSKSVEDLVLWRVPKESAIIFGGATAVYLAYLLNPFSASTICCYVVALVTLSAFLWAQVGNLVSKSSPPVPAFLTRGLTEEEAHNFVGAVLPTLNKVLGAVGVLVSGKDLKMSISVFLGSYIAARVFNFVAPITLAYIVVLAAFTLPKVYEQKQAEIDKVIAVVKAKVDELAAKFHEIISKIPKASATKKAQ